MKLFLGPAGIPTTCMGDNEAGAKSIAKLGLTAMELQFTYGVNLSIESAKRIGQTAVERGVKLSIHAPYYINLCQQDPLKLIRSKKNVSDTAKRAEILGAKVIVFHPGAYMGAPKEDAMERVKKACRELSKNTTVNLGLEITGKQGQFGTLDEVIEVCKEVKGCVPVVDFAHMYARAAGHIDYKEIFEKLSKLRLEYHHFHFSGINFTVKSENLGNEKNHEPIFIDHPPLKPLAEAVLASKKDTTIICESPMLEQDSLKMKKIFEGLGYNF
jgi:deoxyribonuclease-4